MTVSRCRRSRPRPSGRRLGAIIAGAALLVALAIEPAGAAGGKTAPRHPTVCTEQYAPVCGRKGGKLKTYSNACFAAVDRAQVVASGPCHS